MVAAVGVATCRLGDIIGKPQGALLFVEPAMPDSLKDSSAFGSAALRINAVNIENKGDGDLRWSARTKHGSPWVTLDPDTGTAGQSPTLQVIFDPSGLDSAVYQDTVVVEAVSGGVQEVPLWYYVHSCRTTPISLDDSVSSTLTSADCGAPHRPGRFAKLYRFSGIANDSLSVEVTAGFDAYLAMDTSLAANGPALVEEDDCLGASGNPCIYYTRLPLPATYYVEVTSADSADTGAFKLRVFHKRAPLDPTSLDQLSADSTSIPLGGADSLPSILLRAVVSDPDLGDTLHLEAEVRSVSAGFTGSPTATGDEVANGSPAYVTQSLNDNTAYHWRVRAVDQTGQVGGWVEYGGNPTSAPDFLVDVPQAPVNPGALGQLEGDSSTSIGTGASARSDTVVLRAQASDPDPNDLLRLLVEVKPTTTTFTNNATDSSARVNVGGVAFVRVGPLPNNVNYHWQAWTVDETGRSSGRVSYGGNSEGSTDFRIQVPNLPNVPASLNQFQSDGSTVIPPGGDANTPTVIFKGTVSDPDVGQTVRLEVEVQPSTTTFSNTATATSNLVANGSVAQVNVTSPTIVAGGDYHWQARAVDNTSLGSAWVSFPPDTGRDFHVATTVAELVFTQQPAVDTAGRPVRPAVIVVARDVNHNVVTSFNGPITMSILNNAGGGTLTGTTVVNATAGSATFSNLIIDKAGIGYTLQATTGTINSLASSAFNVVAGPAVRLLFTGQPSTTQATLPITPAVVVTALDAQSNTATSFTSAVSVAILANPSGGILGGTTSQPASAGVATFSNLTIDKLGTGYTLRSTATGVASDTSVAFDITPLGAVHLEFTTNPTNTAAGAAINSPGGVVVTAKDQSGQTVTTFTQTVTIGIGSNPSGGSLVSSTPTVAAVGGIATFTNLRIDLVGNGYTLTASSAGLPAVGSLAFNITPGTTTQLFFSTQPANATAGVPISPAVVVGGRDQFGNVTNLSGSFTMGFAANPNGGAFTASSTTIVTASLGVATFANLRINKAGPGYAIVATQSALTTGASTTFTITPAPPVSLTFTTQPTTTAAGAAISPAVVVTARDSLANTATSFVSLVSMTIAAGPVGGAFAPTSTNSATAAAGVATFGNLRIYQAGSGYQLQASGGALASPLSNPFTINNGGGTHLVITTQPANPSVVKARIDSAIGGVVVMVQDSVGNTVPFGGTVRMGILSGTGTPGAILGGTLAKAAPSGIAAFADLTIDRLGTAYQLQTTSTTPSLPSDESTPFDVVPGPATKLAITTAPPSSAQSGVAFVPQPVIQLQDVNGFAVSQAGVLVTATIATNPGGSPSLANATATTNASGTATFSGLAINGTAGSYTLTFSAPGLTSINSGAIALSAGGPTQLAFGQQPTSTTAGASISPAVTVRLLDGSGNLTSSTANVTLAISSGTGTGGAHLSGGASVTVAAVGGIATFSTLNVDSAGTGYTLTATSGTLTSAISNAFNITAGAANKLAFLQQPTSTTAGTSIAPPVTVRILDALGNQTASTANVTVAITPGTGKTGAHLSGGASVTVAASGGVATFSTLNIDSIGTGYRLDASSGVLTGATSTTFNITAGVVSASQSTVVAAPPSITACDNAPPCTTGGGTASQITVTARDGSGNPISGASVTLSASGAGNGFSPASPLTTDGSGVATALFRSTVAEGKTISATINTVSINQTAAVTVTAAAVSAANSILSASPGTITASNGSSASTITATAKDEFGNLIQGLTVVLASSGTGNTVTQPGSTTNGSGQATGTLSSTKAEGKTVSATIGGVPITQTASVTVNPAAVSAGQSSVSASSPITASNGSSAATITVTARDQFDNPIQNAAVVLTANPTTGNTLTQPAGNTNSSGVATGTLSSTKAESKTVSATIDGVTITQTAGVTVNAAAVDHLSFTVQPSNTQAGQTMTPAVVVEIRDAFNNLVTGATDNVTLVIGTDPSGGLGTLSGGGPIAAAGGVATFANLSIDIFGIGNGYTLNASAAGMTGAGSNSFNITP